MNIFSTNKTLNKIDIMIDNAINGNEVESEFNESRVSSIESKLHKYLVATGSHKQKLSEEKQRIDELISDISHQTKTPLSNIILYSELLSECKTDEQQKEYTKLLTKQTEKLEFLINSLVKTSRLENGIIAPTSIKQNISLLMDSVKSTFPSVSVKNIDLNATYDLKWTNESVNNIIDNAIKYGATQIEVSVTPYTMFCRIDIKDNGIGIEEQEIPKIFTRFYRCETSNNVEGVGIGLYLAREIITKQDGYIKVSSRINEGSTFSIFLPM